jgi:hypothetical protein
VSGSARTGSALFVLFLFVAIGFVWFPGSTNPYTPAGYVGYPTKGAVFGRSSF